VDPDPNLPLTGERTVPGIAAENYWLRRHEAAYGIALPYCRGARVLEAGCGEGYGAALIATVAEAVVAVDYDASTATHAVRHYRQLLVVRGNLVELPVAGAGVDVIVALQVIEHLWDQPRFLRRVRPRAAPWRDAHPVHSEPAHLLSRLGSGYAAAEPGSTPGSCLRRSSSLLPEPLRPLRLLGLRHGTRLRDLDKRYGGLVAAQLATAPDH